MANIFCPTEPNPCTDAANPISNFSSEEPDREVFIARNYGPPDPPPLGSSWRTAWCRGVCISTISQTDANLCAARLSILCWVNENPQPDPNNPPTPDNPNPPPIYYPTYGNEPQECQITCPDGQVFVFQVPADTVIAFSQQAANDQAHSIACNAAITNQICIGDLGLVSVCVDGIYDEEVTITSPLPIQSVTVTSGALPHGINLTHDTDSFTLSGVASSIGQYDFTIRAQNFLGDFMDKSFSVYVLEVSPATLPDGIVGTAYSQSMTLTGPTLGAVTWAVTAGFLPPGLTLNASTGLLSGTPTAQGSATFTISGTDER